MLEIPIFFLFSPWDKERETLTHTHVQVNQTYRWDVCMHAFMHISMVWFWYNIRAQCQHEQRTTTSSSNNDNNINTTTTIATLKKIQFLTYPLRLCKTLAVVKSKGFVIVVVFVFLHNVLHCFASKDACLKESEEEDPFYVSLIKSFLNGLCRVLRLLW